MQLLKAEVIYQKTPILLRTLSFLKDKSLEVPLNGLWYNMHCPVGL